MEVTTLRIDNAERMASQLADQEISPTQYMVSFLRQRGWQLPNTTLTIPNVIPEVRSFCQARLKAGLMSRRMVAGHSK